MSVDIGRAIQEGGRRTLARNGLYFVAIVWVLGVLNGLFSASMARSAMQGVPGRPPMGPAPMGPSLGLSPAAAGLLSLLVSLAGLVVVAGAMRTFVTQDTETIPGERFTRNLGWMLVNLVIGGIAFGIVVGIGFVLLVVPGLFLLVSLFFWGFYVVVEDQNFVEGFRNSWALTRGNRLVLFALGVLVAVIGLVVSWTFGIVQFVGPGGWVGLLVTQIGSAFASVFGLATAARTYRQLTEESAADSPTAP